MAQFERSNKYEEAVQELKRRLIIVPILTLPIEGKEYTVYGDSSKNRLGCVPMQDNKVIACTSKQTKPYEKNYPT